MKCYIGPFIWDVDHYRGPSGTNTLIDLRNYSQMSQANKIGMGIFEGNIDDSNYELLGDCTDNSSAKIRSTWKSLTGYQPKGNTISDLIFNHLTEGADPKGLDQPKPLMPKTGHRLNVYLGNQVIKTKRFNFRRSLETNKIQIVLQNDYREIYNNNYTMRRKFIGFYERKFKIPNFHNYIIPKELPKEISENPTTIISDNFDGADSAILGKQLTWIEGGDGTFWDNFNNRARRLTEIFDEDSNASYANSALSGSDQATSAEIFDLVAGDDVGPICRRNNTAVTFYSAFLSELPPNEIQIHKIITGIQTALGSPITVSFANGDSIKLEVIGSDLKSFLNGVLKNSITDTSITGNLFCGIYAASLNLVSLDNFSAQDIGVDSGGSSTLLMFGI